MSNCTGILKTFYIDNYSYIDYNTSVKVCFTRSSDTLKNPFVNFAKHNNETDKIWTHKWKSQDIHLDRNNIYFCGTKGSKAVHWDDTIKQFTCL
jgi:hypothetical protein